MDQMFEASVMNKVSVHNDCYVKPAPHISETVANG